MKNPGSQVCQGSGVVHGMTLRNDPVGRRERFQRNAGQVSWLADQADDGRNRLQWRNRGGFTPPSPIKPIWVLAPGVQSSGVKAQRAANNVSLSRAVVNVGAAR